ncbi:MAG: uracil-DNA glycosylase [Planctomycetes bacterium]|nr:uracil-DNA glycosylase [Planctomycetota bacterium]
MFGGDLPIRVPPVPGARRGAPQAPRLRGAGAAGAAGGSRSGVISGGGAVPAGSGSLAGSPAAASASPPADAAERERRERLLAPIRAEAAGCSKCGLCRRRTQAVFGAGDPCARLMFVGEAPGFDEDRRGEPFVGKAGRLLTDIIEKGMRLRRGDVYIANVIKCHPPGNRNPDASEIAECLPYLERQIEIVAPEVICALGLVAARALLDRPEASISALRGRFHQRRGIAVRVTYHPAYLLRSPAEKRKAWEDVQAIMKLLGIA